MTLESLRQLQAYNTMEARLVCPGLVWFLLNLFFGISYMALIFLGTKFYNHAIHDWLVFTEPVKDFMATFIPSISNFSDYLIKTEQNSRVLPITNLVSFVWLIMILTSYFLLRDIKPSINSIANKINKSKGNKVLFFCMIILPLLSYASINGVFYGEYMISRLDEEFRLLISIICFPYLIFWSIAIWGGYFYSKILK